MNVPAEAAEGMPGRQLIIEITMQQYQVRAGRRAACGGVDRPHAHRAPVLPLPWGSSMSVQEIIQLYGIRQSVIPTRRRRT